MPRLQPERGALILAIALAIIAATASALIAPLVGRATDAALAGDQARLTMAAIGLGAVVLIRFVTSGLGQVRLVAAAERVLRRVRDELVERLASAPLRFVETHRTGDLVTRATSELETLSGFVRSQLPGTVTIGGYLIASLVVLLATSWQLTLLTAMVLAPATTLLSSRFARRSASAFGAEAAAHATVEATFAETLDARETLQLARAESRWRTRYADDNASLLAAIRHTIRALLLFPVLHVVEVMTVAAVLTGGWWLAGRGAVSVGTVIVFVVAADRLFDAVLDATGLVGEVQESRVTIARLLDLLEVTTPQRRGAADPTDAALDLPTGGDLVVEGVGFRYEADPPVLHDVSLHLSPGDRVALAGRTGSGKTTLAKILTGLYRPETGTVRYAGRDIHDLPVAGLRRHVALVPQQVHLIAGSLLDNVRLVPNEPDRTRVEKVVEDLGLQDWVARIGGLDADLGPDGTRLSAGERQLVAFARAALLDPSVLVMDEATADLDPTSAALVQEALQRLHHGRTVLIIAHRDDATSTFPRTLAMVDGRLVHDTAPAIEAPDPASARAPSDDHRPEPGAGR